MSEFIEEFEHFLFQFIDFYFSFDNQIFHFLSQFDVDNIKSVQNLISSFQYGFSQFLLNFVEYVINSITNVHQFLIVDCDSEVPENFKYLFFKLSNLDFSFGDQFLDFFTDNTLGNIKSIQDFVNSFQQSLSQLFLDSVNDFTVSICQSSFMSEFVEKFEDFFFQFINLDLSFHN